jgi:hypothetical protein
LRIDRLGPSGRASRGPEAQRPRGPGGVGWVGEGAELLHWGVAYALGEGEAKKKNE